MTERKRLIITIDGPSGAGKSTIAKALAKRLGYTFIDTGAMYRGVAYAYKVQGPDGQESEGPRGGEQAQPSELLRAEWEAPPALLTEGATRAPSMAEFLKGLSLRIEFEGETRVFLDGVDISKEIRTPEMSLLASSLSQRKEVREYLYKVQREIGSSGGVVLEGRDTGSVVFPDAPLKFYLDADPEERAKRRHLELAAKGAVAPLEEVHEEMIKRDKNDSERNIAPLVVPQGALRVDTTGTDIEGVLNILLKHATDREAK